MDINLEFDSAAQAAPASFRTGLQTAASLLDAAVSTPITVNIEVQYGENGIDPTSADAGPDAGQFVPYSTVRSDLIAGAAPGDTNFNALPAGSSIQGQTQVAVWNAQLKAVGLLAANANTLDGTADFGTGIPQNLLVGVALHELAHAMGRVPYGPEPDIFDLFRFTSPGMRLFDSSIPETAAYFSVDGGNTKLADYGQNSDPSDFLNDSLSPEDPFNEFYDSNTIQHLTNLDLRQLDVLGFNTGALTHIPPTVYAVSNISVSENQSIAASSLISLISNPSGDSITLDIFKDDGGGSGYFTVNGVPQPDGQWIIPTSSSDNVQYVGGSSPGTDTLEVGIYDYTTNQYYTSSTTTSATTAAPATVTGGSFSIGPDRSVEIASYLSVSNPSGDDITEYAFYDAGGGNGYLTLGGTAEPDGQWVSVSPSNLSSVDYVGGSSAGSQTLSVAIYDATTGAWSANSFTATTTSPASVTGYNFSVHPHQRVAISSHFSLSNPSGDNVVEYAFFDQGGGRGHFTVGGTAQPNGQWISTSDPSSVDYVGRSWRGPQTLEVAVNDGTTGTWSPISFFTATTTAAHHTHAANSGGISSAAEAVGTATNLAMLQPILGGATLEVPSADAGSVTFAGATGTLLLDDSSSFTGTVAGMTGEDTLDFRNIHFTAFERPTYAGISAGGTLTVSDGTHAANIALSGNYTSSTFVASSDGHGGTSVVSSPTAANHSWM